MPAARNRRIVLAARPVGEPKDENFRLEETNIPVPAEGEVLLRTEVTGFWYQWKKDSLQVNSLLLHLVPHFRFQISEVSIPRSSRPGELHPEPVTDPDVTLARHPARAVHERLSPFILV